MTPVVQARRWDEVDRPARQSKIQSRSPANRIKP
jgi:hypothetical protein